MRRRGNCALVVLIVAADTIKNLAPATEWGSRGYLIASKGVTSTSLLIAPELLFCNQRALPRCALRSKRRQRGTDCNVCPKAKRPLSCVA